jgi:hypothetical protein
MTELKTIDIFAHNLNASSNPIPTPTPNDDQFQTPSACLLGKRNSWSKEEKDLFFTRLQKMATGTNLNQLFVMLSEVSN